MLLCISSCDDDDDDDIVYPLSNKEKLSKNQVPLLLIPPNCEIRGVASWGSMDALAPHKFQEKRANFRGKIYIGIWPNCTPQSKDLATPLIVTLLVSSFYQSADVASTIIMLTRFCKLGL